LSRRGERTGFDPHEREIGRRIVTHDLTSRSRRRRANADLSPDATTWLFVIT